MLRGGVLYIMLTREILNRANRGVKVGSSRHTGFYFPPIVTPQGLSVLLKVLLPARTPALRVVNSCQPIARPTRRQG